MNGEKKPDFLADINHKLRTPLSNIIGFSELAQDGDIPEKTRDYLANISKNAEQLLNNVNEILENLNNYTDKTGTEGSSIENKHGNEPAQDTSSAASQASENVSNRPMFSGEVLICEDSKMNQLVICDHLERVGIQSVVAKDGKEGLDIVAKRLQENQKPFDLIFMDIHMPVMDGLEATSKIQELGVKTPIVAITANIMFTKSDQYKTHGMSYILGKPFKAEELWKCLMNFLPYSFT